MPLDEASTSSSSVALPGEKGRKISVHGAVDKIRNSTVVKLSMGPWRQKYEHVSAPQFSLSCNRWDMICSESKRGG